MKNPFSLSIDSFCTRFFGVLLLALLPLSGWSQFSRSDESIATGIYTLMLNTTWENQSSFQQFEIGVLDGDTSFYQVVRRKYEGISVRGKKVKVTRFESIDAIQPTQMLYVSKKFNKKIEKIAKATAGNHTLLLTNSCRNDDYTMVDFNGRLKKDDFQVNQENMAKAGLRLSEQFEDFAEGNVAWEELLVESKQQLAEAQEKVASKDATIRSQKKKINYQKLTLEEKIEMLDKQSGLLEEQAQQLEDQSREIKKRDNTLIYQDKQIAEQKVKLNSLIEKLGMQRTIIVLFFALLFLVLGIGYVIFRNYAQKKKSINDLAEQHTIVSRQKDQIEKILLELTDSIRYALRIQNAVLPNEQTLRGTVPGDFFVMYKPKDIVSGDFFFVDRRGDWTLVAVADCTGHGVPGAFVSMLCISLLNEIVKQQDVLQANLILNELRDKVISSLQQKGIQGEQMDGMDISLLLINRKTHKCQWSGANNPLYIVSSKTRKLEELKPDKRPIAIYPDMDAFTNHEVSVSKGDTLYLFTDGYSDQFGGEKGKKFMSRNFKNLLVENAHKPMSEQQRILDHTIETWKQGHDQIDDITVVGIRVN